MWVNGFNGFWEAFKAIDTGNKYVFDAAIMKIGQYAQPLMCAFTLRDIQPQQLLFSFYIERQNEALLPKSF
ncbi:hypothetical protein STH12_02449 [Shewanella khirikhana]|uniref:Uncharacterized protein n=1 Tax=Shewanella khirikhana TaxID=1965282 RepID=A0ABM7DPD1_9GAMM|nr:hypothetical protein STH12_02449 [Shewanella khirikhana]